MSAGWRLCLSLELHCYISWVSLRPRSAASSPSACAAPINHIEYMDSCFYANFSAHCQYGRTDTRIHQSAWPPVIGSMITCVFLPHFIHCRQALCSAAVHLFRRAKSCLFSLFPLWDVACRLIPHLLGEVDHATLPWTPLLWKSSCSCKTKGEPPPPPRDSLHVYWGNQPLEWVITPPNYTADLIL